MPPRLLTRLQLSHSVPVLLVTLALAVLLLAMGKLTVVLGTLSENELLVLRDEGTLHRAMWDVDVAVRHAQEDCEEGPLDAQKQQAIVDHAAMLEKTLAQARPDAPMRPMASQYLALAAGDLGCDALLKSSMQREHLDENLTNLWVTRLEVLHNAVSAKEEEARTIAVSAIGIGIAVTLFAIAAAMVFARRMARSVSAPLEALAEVARRVGVGDFSSTVAIEGPREVQALAASLEHMRNQLAELDTLKQGFLASVSHELRTPLAKIRESLALLGGGVVGTLDAKQARVLAIAKDACEREIRLVATMLDLSRLRSGNPLQLRDATDVSAIVASAVKDESAEADTRGVQLVTDVGAAPPLRLDPVLLERAIANLVRNAVAASKSGQKVSLRLQTAERVEITVKDDGPGVPTAIRSNVFEAFVSHSAGGVGVGLALAREVARAHGGDLILDDTERGAQFRLWLPKESA